ncbi:hypothetical protein CV102_19775 [Natronococcus pandeyae]|uniref:Uncharacterized protein n=2 Tax=Natronococcus pandeyae TaxID=2055836 RepID=A0A8J8Q231_9EURY|nr:hypothetical protein CV102_19775 [Natronococcus pandeyae]
MTVMFVVLVTLYWISLNTQMRLFQIPGYLIAVFISLLDSLLLGLLGEFDLRVVEIGTLIFLSIGFGVLSYRIRT